MSPTCVELFAGAGGLSLGLAQAGFSVRAAYDLQPAAVRTYRHNLGNHAHVADVRELSGAGILASAGLAELDLLAGGPPCQGFSKQRRGAHLGADGRNLLVLEWARLVEEARPRAFLFENVEAFGQARGRALLGAITDRLGDWEIHPMNLLAADHGTAQRRGRFVMLGFRRDLRAATPVVLRSAPVTIRDAIGDLPPPPADGSEHPLYPGHSLGRLSALNRERFSYVPPGGGWRDIPHHLRLPCHQRMAGAGGWPDVYGRLEWEGQCPTLTAGFDSFTRGRYGHPEQHRALTLREGARLQGFPDWFRFLGNRHDVRLQIGNAVPPPLGMALGRALRAAMA